MRSHHAQSAERVARSRSPGVSASRWPDLRFMYGISSESDARAHAAPADGCDFVGGRVEAGD